MSVSPSPASASAIAPVPEPPAGERTKYRIELQDLVKIYRGRKVVSGVSAHIEQGEIVGLLGPNGAGKTTTFYMTVGLVRPNSGRILLNGKDITKQPMYKRARLGIGYLAQEASVFRSLTARENILLVLEMVNYPARERRARADELLADLHITERADERSFKLSGGERRRVEIARALAANPAFLMLDEPFTGIDPRAIEDIGQIIHGLKARGIGILITDHNAMATLRLTDRTYILADGAIVTQGTAQEVAEDPIARKFYLGENFRL